MEALRKRNQYSSAPACLLQKLGVLPADSRTPVSFRGVRLAGRVCSVGWNGGFVNGRMAVGGNMSGVIGEETGLPICHGGTLREGHGQEANSTRHFRYRRSAGFQPARSAWHGHLWFSCANRRARAS